MRPSCHFAMALEKTRRWDDGKMENEVKEGTPHCSFTDRTLITNKGPLATLALRRRETCWPTCPSLGVLICGSGSGREPDKQFLSPITALRPKKIPQKPRGNFPFRALQVPTTNSAPHQHPIPSVPSLPRKRDKGCVFVCRAIPSRRATLGSPSRLCRILCRRRP